MMEKKKKKKKDMKAWCPPCAADYSPISSQASENDIYLILEFCSSEQSLKPEKTRDMDKPPICTVKHPPTSPQAAYIGMEDEVQ